MPPTTPLHEPHKIKTVRLVAFPTLEERKRNLSRAHFNIFNLTPSQVTFDMVSYGTSAMSQEQLAGQLVGDEAYAGRAQLRDARRRREPRPRPHLRLPDAQQPRRDQAPRHDAHPDGLARPEQRASAASTSGRRAAIEIADVRDRDEPVFTGNVDLPRLEDAPRREQQAAVVVLQCLRRRAAPLQPREPPRRPRHGRPARPAARARRLPRHRERLVHPAPRGGAGRPVDRRHRQADRQDGPRRPPRRRPGPEVQHRRPPRHRQPGRPRALHERGRRLRGAPHVRRHGRADDGGPRPRPRRDVRRGRGPVGHAPDGALHRAPARRRASRSSGAATAPTSRPTSSCRTSPEHPAARPRGRALPDRPASARSSPGWSAATTSCRSRSRASR